jgi:hypothetical protein
MLSQVRWILATAIGVAIVVAVWLEPDVRDPSGEPAVPRTLPAENLSTNTPSGQTQESPSVEWQSRLRAYWHDVDRILAKRSGSKADHEKIRDALRTRHFTVEERPTVRALDATRYP